MDKVYFKICRLGDIPEEMDSPPTPPSQPVTITKPPPLPSIPNIPAPPTPKKLSAKVEIEPKGLNKSMRNMKKEKDQNRKKFPTTRIKKTWSESKLISGKKFQIEKYKQYAEPIVTTRKTSSSSPTKKRKRQPGDEDILPSEDFKKRVKIFEPAPSKKVNRSAPLSTKFTNFSNIQKMFELGTAELPSSKKRINHGGK